MSSNDVQVVLTRTAEARATAMRHPYPVVGEPFRPAPPGVHSEVGVLRAAMLDAGMRRPSREDRAVLVVPVGCTAGASWTAPPALLTRGADPGYAGIVVSRHRR